jgi:NADPH:quinone reductase-like Zn-dependent oxidoreductase
VAEDAPIALMPDDLTFEGAAAVCDGVVLAITCLRWAGVSEGQRVLVHGASGSIGTAGVQLAKHLGAHVTAVSDADGDKLEVVRSLGADVVVDRSLEDFTARGETYDVVFDAVGKIGFGAARKVLARGGTFVSTDFGPKGQVPVLAVLTRITRLLGTRRVLMPLPRYGKEHVLLAKQLIEAGEYRAVVDRTYALEQVVEATRYVESGRKTGNVVLLIDEVGPA